MRHRPMVPVQKCPITSNLNNLKNLKNLKNYNNRRMTAPSQFDIDLEDFVQFLQLVRSLSPNTVSAYRSDVEFFFEFLKDPASFGIQLPKVAGPRDATPDHLGKFLRIGYDNDITQRSQARRLSAIKAFYKFLDAGCNPCDQVAVPKLARKLPTVLSVDEVLSIIEQVDLTEPEGSRNRAILEMLYSCGLRVSELVNLKLSDLFFNEGFIRIVGKGNKQRLIPIGEYAITAVEDYRPARWSVLQRAKTIGGSGGKHSSGGKSSSPGSKHSSGGKRSSPGIGKLSTSMSAKGAGKGSAKGIDEDVLFLNRRGGKLTREMVFNIVKRYSEQAGINKDVSPHTFRHSFATHLVENGADLRVVQDMLGHSSILTTEIYTHIGKQLWMQDILEHHPARK